MSEYEFTLKPRKSGGKPYILTPVEWTYVLDNIAGYAMNTGRIEDKYVFVPGKAGEDPRKREGFYVDSERARAMSLCIEGWAAVNQNNDKIPEDFLGLMIDFSAWLYECKGFWVR